MLALSAAQQREALVILTKLMYALLMTPSRNKRDTPQRREETLVGLIKLLQKYTFITSADIGMPEDLFQKIKSLRV